MRKNGQIMNCFYSLLGTCMSCSLYFDNLSYLEDKANLFNLNPFILFDILSFRLEFIPSHFVCNRILESSRGKLFTFSTFVTSHIMDLKYFKKTHNDSFGDSGHKKVSPL
ncbi:hypothetical protein BpHYR1_026503 [Brachionus plicatilis]|uniref:Uncharacterized protein n=1 Tax=Brachionus plicatilis TaxID=10195 RepID=A0A3M7P9Z7_BRAPC|nr:hypothetical protein BpHYR1_026503 [Brachionus plicatilis]